MTAPLFAKGRAPWSVLATLLATGAGAIVAGAGNGLFNQRVGLGGGAVCGPLFVFSAIVQDPVTLAVWILGALAVHRTACRPIP